jgi:tyrosine-protein kinase Etk/Wzc
VIIDTPPTLVVSDGLILAPKVDAVILVADASTTSRGAARHLREELEQVGGNIIGGVFNNFDPARAKYYTSYGSYYGGYRYEPEKAKRSKRGAEGEITGPSPEEIWRTEDIWT